MNNIDVLDADVDTRNTTLQGTIQVSYDVLVEVLGYPTRKDTRQTNVYWEGHHNGSVFTIYDWMADEDYHTVTDWYIGGDTQDAVQAVYDVLYNRYGERIKHIARFHTVNLSQ